jgi:hypothetical protein
MTMKRPEAEAPGDECGNGRAERELGESNRNSEITKAAGAVLVAKTKAS